MNIHRASLRQLQRYQSLRSLSFSKPCVLAWCRSYSGSHGSSNGKLDFSATRAEMLARPPQLSWDVMSPTNSSLLNIALADFIPENCQAPAYRAGARSIEKVNATVKLPEGHHLVYFPLQKPTSELCPDNTDPLHSPGDPFARRMWAGGSIEFNDDLRLDSSSVVCNEIVNEVTVKGTEGQEKIFVDVLREYMKKADFENTRLIGLPMAQGIREHRSLVFMRGVSPEQARANLLIASKGERRVVKAPNAPDFSITFTPTPTLLFNYSALTFNAHLIHLDPEFCREVEGHPNLLVHGPLSLTLMLSVLRSRLDPDEKIYRIDYRNLAPLYVSKPMRICVRLIENGGKPVEEKSRKWDVWVEGHDGGLSVRGTALTLRSSE